MAINNKDYKAYGPFKLWTIENFPFIEEDFDAITNYQLWCKIVENMKKLIENQTTLEISQKEVINAFNELETYVNNYFENLDIQTEIDNKLDEMAESGELVDIIAQYLDLAGVLSFNTISDLHNAENLANGSIAYTLGQNTYNDGKGAFYKIRLVTTSDVIDEFNIVSIVADNTIIGERLPNYYINDLQSQIDVITEDIENITNKKWIFIGDSYSQGYNPDGNVTGWSTLLKNKMGLDNNHCIIADAGGAGFANPSHPYYDIIDSLSDDNDVTDVLIAGGYNDLSFAGSAIETGMTNCKSLINEKFPNAKIHIAFIGGTSGSLHGDIHLRVYYYMNSCKKLNLNYLANLQYLLYNATYFASDGIHPTQDGQTNVANGLYQALNGGFNYTNFQDIQLDTSYSDNFNASLINMHLYSNNSISILENYSGNIYLSSTGFALNNGADVKLGKLTQLGIIGSKYIRNSMISIGEVVIRSTSNPSGYWNVPAQIYVAEDGMLYLKLLFKINDSHNNYQSFGNVTEIQINTFSIVYPTDLY